MIGRLAITVILPVVAAVAVLGARAPTAQAGSGMSSSGSAVVRTSDGLIRGVVSANHRTFSGIQYAAAPVGELRWQPPRPEPPWRGIHNAIKPGSVCPQQGGPGQPKVVGSENCLYLNVTTPIGHGPVKWLPVMVWFHGGGFATGAGSEYDTTRLVTKGNVIAVTVNYRLGALGFLDLPALAADGAYAGDYALADQQAALRWVRRNAAAFGGDPQNVTIFGQSAGAYSVCANLAAPGSRGLFQKAIVQSGPCSNAFVTTATALRRDTKLVAGLGCSTAADVVACLRTKPASDFVALDDSGALRIAPLNAVPWEFTVGGQALPQQPFSTLLSGTAARVPLILGSNRDEMTVAVAVAYNLQGKPVTDENYLPILTQLFGRRASAIAAAYPLAAYPSAFRALSAVITDWGRMPIGACPMLPLDDAASRRAPVYAYEFAQDDGLKLDGLHLGATHGSELPYLFDGTFDWSPPPPPNPALAAQMISYWTQFAHTGNPNGGMAAYWPGYRPGRRILSLAAGPGGIALTDFAANHHCSFWHER